MRPEKSWPESTMRSATPPKPSSRPAIVRVDGRADEPCSQPSTVIHSGVPWVTLQGRPKGGKVRLIDGKKLAPGTGGFMGGLRLTIRREGSNLIVAVNDQDLLSRPLLTSGVGALLLTLENFDPGTARFNLGDITYREWVEAPAAGS